MDVQTLTGVVVTLGFGIMLIGFVALAPWRW